MSKTKVTLNTGSFPLEDCVSPADRAEQIPGVSLNMIAPAPVVTTTTRNKFHPAYSRIGSCRLFLETLATKYKYFIIPGT